MGGGYGLFSASKFRVLTERSRLAPEITIGCSPMPEAPWCPWHKMAALLTLTGSQMTPPTHWRLG